MRYFGILFIAAIVLLAGMSSLSLAQPVQPVQNPYIVRTDPAAGATDVPLDKNITIYFNEPVRYVLLPETWGDIGDLSGAEWTTVKGKADKDTQAIHDMYRYIVVTSKRSVDVGYNTTATPGSDLGSVYIGQDNRDFVKIYNPLLYIPPFAGRDIPATSPGYVGLKPDTTYTITVKRGTFCAYVLEIINGSYEYKAEIDYTNPNDYSFYFTTVHCPMVASSTPANKETGFPTDKNITLTFETDMKESSYGAFKNSPRVRCYTFIDNKNTPVPVTWSLSGKRLIVTPSEQLRPDLWYNVDVIAGAFSAIDSSQPCYSYHLQYKTAGDSTGGANDSKGKSAGSPGFDGIVALMAAGVVTLYLSTRLKK